MAAGGSQDAGRRHGATTNDDQGLLFEDDDPTYDRPGLKLLSDSDSEEDLHVGLHEHTLPTDTESSARFVRNIVAEVSAVMVHYRGVLTLCFILQTAPTLLLTTVGLVFTGELLERISVRCSAPLMSQV